MNPEDLFFNLQAPGPNGMILPAAIPLMLLSIAICHFYLVWRFF